MQNLLEDCGIELTSVVSDFLGVSGRRMLEALITGERDQMALAELAAGRLRTWRDILV
ncbi:hypothetical protein ACFYW6_38485 [Streptomyces sp. NPDC002659]|uniref:hypothetical protein n=1 Tax=Streptomyces sp. NPDC002659 TaxID=3364656 RepID=UPI0036924BEA